MSKEKSLYGLREYATDSDGEESIGEDKESAISGLFSGSENGTFFDEFESETEVTSETVTPHSHNIEQKHTKNQVINEMTVNDSNNEYNAMTKIFEKELVVTRDSWDEIVEREKNSHKPKAIIIEKGRKYNGDYSSRYSNKKNEYISPADKTDNWRSGSYNKRNNVNQERKSKPSSRRRPRNDSPLINAVERPFTLPPGEVTILKRPTNIISNKLTNNKSNSSDVSNEINNGNVNNNENKDVLKNDKGEQMTSNNVKMVETKYGVGIVVQNPMDNRHKREGSASTSASTSASVTTSRELNELKHGRLKMAEDEARRAMSGLSMGPSSTTITATTATTPNGQNIQSSRELRSSSIKANGSRHVATRQNSLDSSYDRSSYNKSYEDIRRNGKRETSSRIRNSRIRSSSHYFRSDYMNDSRSSTVYIGPRPRPRQESRAVTEDDFYLGE